MLKGRKEEIRKPTELPVKQVENQRSSVTKVGKKKYLKKRGMTKRMAGCGTMEMVSLEGQFSQRWQFDQRLK